MSLLHHFVPAHTSVFLLALALAGQGVTLPRYRPHMSAAGLEVRVHEGRERAEATRVTWAINEVVRSMEEIDRVYLMRGTRATWVLADMARDADELVVRLEPGRVSARRDLADMAVPANALVRGASSLQKDASVPDMFAPSTVRRIAALATPTRGVQSVALATYNGSVSAAVELTDAVHEHAEAAVAPFEVTYGSVVGRVSRLSDRRGGNVGFAVRQEQTGHAVEGSAESDMSEDLRAAWKHRCLLGGRLKRNAKGQVIRLEVDRLELLPEGPDLRPRVEELLGSAPDWLAGMTTEQWMAEVRRG